MSGSAPKQPRLTTADLRRRLKASGFRSGDILLDETRIGGFVTYGKGGSRGNIGSRTVYGSRIYQPGLRIEAEASTSRVMLDRVATALARAVKAGAWSLPAPVPVADPVVTDAG